MYISSSRWHDRRGRQSSINRSTPGATRGSSDITHEPINPNDTPVSGPRAAAIRRQSAAWPHFHVWRHLRHLLLHPHPPGTETAKGAGRADSPGEARRRDRHQWRDHR